MTISRYRLPASPLVLGATDRGGMTMPREEECEPAGPADAVERTSGSGTDEFEDDDLNELREDWPE